MGNQEFIDLCRKRVTEYIDEHLDKTDKKPEYDVYIVWLCKTLGNNKALVSTSLPDGRYYECTYNGNKKELYLDVYMKFDNRCIDLKGE